MNRKHIITVTAAVLTMVAMFLISANQSSAQNKASDFSHVIAIDGGQGTIRFFDTISGRLYTYDRSLQQVIRIVELVELGQPAVVIQDATAVDNRIR